MIIEIIQNENSNANRGDAGHRVMYIFGASKDAISKHTHKITIENIHFVGTSDNLMITDPLFKITKNGFKKISGKDADLKEIIESFEQSERNNSRAQVTHLHVVFSLQEDEKMTMDQWKEAIDIWVKDMGYLDCTYVSAVHDDTLNQHNHLVVSTIQNTAPYHVVKDSNLFKRSAECRDKIEQKFNLKHSPNPFTDTALTRNTYDNKRSNKVKQNSAKNVNLKNLRKTVSNALNNEDVVSLIDFIKALEKLDVGVNVRLAKGSGQLEKGMIEGISFSQNGTKIKASTLGKNFQWPALSKRLEYHHSFDAARVEKLSNIEMKIGNMISRFEQQDHKDIVIKNPSQKNSLAEIYSDDDSMTYSHSTYIVIKTKKKKLNFKQKDILRFNHELKRRIDFLYLTAIKPDYDPRGPGWEDLSAKQKREKAFRIMIKKFVDMIMKWLFGDSYRTTEEEIEDRKLELLNDIDLMTNRMLQNLEHEWLIDAAYENLRSNERTHDCYAQLDADSKLDFVYKPKIRNSNAQRLLNHLKVNRNSEQSLGFTPN